MRLLSLTIVLLMSSLSPAEVQDFNGAIQEASVSQNRLHRKLLHILYGTEVSIADNEAGTTEAPQPLQAAANEVKIRLVKVPTKNF